MQRFTIDDAERALERLCKMVGRRYRHRKSSYREFCIGDWYLEKSSVGNYVRAVQHGEHYSQTLPMGPTFYTYKDFAACVRFTGDALSNCWVIRGEGARGYPAGVLEPVPENEWLLDVFEPSAEVLRSHTDWFVVRPLTSEQPSGMIAS